MAVAVDVGSVELPVRLAVGGVESQVGTVTLSSAADIRTKLPQMLREIADELEKEEVDV